MRKSFTRLFSLVMLLTLFSSVVMASLGDAKGVWPIDITDGAKAWTKTTDKIMVIYPGVVQASRGSIRVSADGTLVRVLTATDSRVSYAKGDTVVIDLSADLKELTNYVVAIDESTFKTVATTPVNKSAESWTFTTGDYTGPTVKSVVPVSGDVVTDPLVTNSATNSLKITFEDAHSAIVAGKGNVTLYKKDGNVWDLIDVATRSVITDSDPNTLTLTSVRALEDNVEYTVTIDAGVVTDAVDVDTPLVGKRADSKVNPFGGLTDRTVWAFSTQDFTAPGYATGYPKKGTVTNNAASVLIKTKETGTAYAVISATDYGTAWAAANVRNDANKRTVEATSAGTEYSINFTALTGNRTYYIYVITDNATAEATIAKRITVKTTEIVAPKLATVTYVKTTPAWNLVASVNGTTGVVTPANATDVVEQKLDKIVLTFTEDQDTVLIGAGNVIIRKVVDNSDYLVIPSTSLKVSKTGTDPVQTTVTIPVTKALENSASYYVIVPNTLILDKYNNMYAGISATNGWRFKTDDTVAPAFTILPADGSGDVARDANIVLTFNELVTYTGTAFKLLQGSADITSDAVVSSSSNDGKFTTITINPWGTGTTAADKFESSAVITLVINDGQITDGGGNPVAVQGQGTTFVVEDFASPAVSWNTDQAISDKYLASYIPVAEFDEPVYLLGGGEILNSNLYTILSVRDGSATGAPVPYTATIDANKRKITITPATPWGSAKHIYISITKDLEDQAGNPFDGADRTFDFSIKDVIPNVVDLSSVDGKSLNTAALSFDLIFKDGSTAQPVSKIYYDGDWQGYTESGIANVIVLKEGSANGPNVLFDIAEKTPGDASTFTITPNPELSGNKTYYVGIAGATKDAVDNINVPKFVTFNTLYVLAPTVISTTPVDNAKQVATNADLIVTFNTDIKLVASGSYTNGVTLNFGAGAVTVPYTDLVVSGATLKILHPTEPTALTANKPVDVVILTGVVLNKTSDAPFTGIASTHWNFNTVDTKLDVTALTPDLISPVVANDTELKITFGEEVSIGSGYIDIKKGDTDGLFERINVPSNNVSISNDKMEVTIIPSSNFAYNQAYYVEVSNGAFVDVYGNKNAAIYGNIDNSALTAWTFKTENPALEIVKTTPADGADKIATNSSIVIEFNRDIVAGTGSIGYVEWNGTTQQIQSYPIGSSNITISGKKLTITHSNKLFPANTEIYLYLEENSIVAASDVNIKNPLISRVASNATLYDGVADDYISFNTGDVNAPIATISPEVIGSPATYIPLNTVFTVTFDEDIYNEDGTTVNSDDLAGMFSINDGTTVNFSGAVSGRTITLSPTSDLEEFNAVTVTLNANQVEDALHTQNSTATVFNFKTVDKSAPEISEYTLAGDDEFITVPDLTIVDAAGNNNKFYYLIRETSGAAAPTATEIMAANDIDISEDPVSSFDIEGLKASTTYQFYYVADDAFGNTSAVAVLEAKTDDTIAPLLVTTVPVLGAINVNLVDADEDETADDVVVKLTFNEPVEPGTDAILVRDYATQGILYTLDETALTAVSGDVNSLNLNIWNFGTGLPPVKLYIEIAKGAITDKATTGVNDYTGAFGLGTISFTTEDNEAPVVVSGTHGTEVALDSNIEIEFSENVKAGTGNLVLYENSVDVDNAIQVFTAAETTFSGKTATVNPTAGLMNGTSYVVGVGAGFAKDMSSNSNENELDETTVSFTASTNVKPVATFSPAGGTTALDVLTFNNIHVDFDGENIYLTIAGYSKPLSLLTQDELLAHIKFVDDNGVNVPISKIEKIAGSASSFDIVFSSDDIADETNYTLTVSGFEEVDGLVMDDAVAHYVTGDGTAPIITFSPAYEATKISPTTNLTLTFSENIYDNAINPNLNVFSYVDNTNVMNFVYLKEGSSTGTDVEFTATIAGKVLTMVPTAELKSGIKYYYGLKRTVEDINGKQITLGEEVSYVYFNAADYTAPKLVAGSFAPNTTSTSSTAAMYVRFDEEVVVSTGSVVIRREDGTIFQTVSGADLSIDATDKTKLKIVHNAFEALTNYFVEVGASAVVDKSGNPNVKFSDPLPATGWLFTTSDTYALTATVTPKGDNTSRSINLEIAFNKVPKGISDKYIAVYKEDGTAVKQVLAFDLTPNGKIISIPVSLEPNQAYYARIEAGAFVDNITPTNVFTGIMDNSWVFSTVDNIAPQVVSLAPADNALAVDASTKAFTMTFDRNVAVGTGVISVRYAVDGKVFEDVDVTKAVVTAKALTFNVTKALDANTAFYVYVPLGAITNTEVTKDSFAGILNTYDWNFTTATDLTAPKFVSGTPTGTMAEGNHPIFVMTFDEDVVLGTGNLKVIKKDGTTPVLTIPVTSAVVAGKTVTVTYVYDATTGGLDKNTDYYVLVDGAVVKDAAGNVSAAVTDVAAWTFKTGPEFVTEIVDPINNSLEFKVYPNPFVDFVTVSNASELTKVVVSNIAGQVVKEVVNPENTIQLNELRSGVYFISLYQENAVIKTAKIVKR